MRIAPLASVKAQFSAYLKRTAEGPVVVTGNGRAVAVLVPIDDEDEIERLVLACSPKFSRLLETAREEIRSGRGISHAEFWKRVGDSKTRKRRGRVTRRGKRPGAPSTGGSAVASLRPVRSR